MSHPSHRSGRSRRLAAALSLLTAACSGRGAADAPARTVFGFPVDAPPASAMATVDAFPGLSFQRPVFVTHPPDGTDRLFVVEQQGRILVFDNDPATAQPGVFLDLTSRVTASTGEMGLLGLAFDPDYATTGEFYVYYMRGGPLESVLSEFRVGADPDVADPNSERVLLVVPQPYANHNAGMLAFGPDGMLYVALGDGGSGNDPLGSGQDPGTLLGSLLRIDPNGSTAGLPYGIPADNPFVTTPGARGEIWAYGLRNPWRFSFDRHTGELWLGDVGQGAREEIDLVTRGANLGWRVFEGTRENLNPQGQPASAFTAPVHDYGRGDGASVTGGYVYRGSRLPELRGAYVYGDFESGRIWALRHTAQGVDNVQLAASPLLASFGEDRDGELYLVSHRGRLLELEPAGPGGGEFPATLSATGLFRDLEALQPADGLVEYRVNAPSWRDGAVVRRFVAAPLQPLQYRQAGPWSMPVGTVVVKHFELELVVGDPQSRRRLETRVLLHEAQGWGGYVYRWNEAGTEARLLGGREQVDLQVTDPMAPGGQRTQRWTFPSRFDCRRCHTEGGAPLALRTEQLRRDVGGQPQIDLLAQQGVVTGVAAGGVAWPDPADPAAPTADRARAWLQTNCAHCHRPAGPAPTAFDLRFEVPTAQMGVVDVRPNQALGLADPWLVRPGDRASSTLYLRLLRRDQWGMPPLGSHEVDAAGAELVGQWIDGL